MAIPIPFDQIDEEMKKQIAIDYTFSYSDGMFHDQRKKVYTFIVDNPTKNIYIPMGSWKKYYDEYPIDKSEYIRRNINMVGRELLTSTSDPRLKDLQDGQTCSVRDQDVVVKEMISQLNENHVTFGHLHTGFGKTSCGIAIACKKKYQTAIITHSDTIKMGWYDTATKFTDAKVQLVKGNKLDPTCDIFIMGIQQATNLCREDFWNDKIRIGMLIIDEMHMNTITALACHRTSNRTVPAAALLFTPMYLIGFTATVRRGDGMTKLLSPYFNEKKHFIRREEKKPFKVIKVETEYEPEIKYVSRMGKTFSDPVLFEGSIANNTQRQQDAVSIVMSNPNEIILVMGSRVPEVKSIYRMLKQQGINADYMDTNKSSYDKTCQVLVVTNKKGGTGMDDPRLTMMIFMHGCKDCEQYEGRIRMLNCTIYDFVDDHSKCENRWNARRKWYIKKGASIVVMSMNNGKLIQSETGAIEGSDGTSDDESATSATSSQNFQGSRFGLDKD